MNASNYVMLRGGLTVPLEPLLLALDLEARGIRLETDDADVIASPREKLTDADRQAVRRWKAHIITILHYTADDSHLFAGIH